MTDTSPLPRRPHHESAASRRDFLVRAGGGLGALALLALLEREGRAAEPAPGGPVNPVAPRPAHFRGKARSVIWIFLDGGPSHVDLFDPKPELTRLAGKPLPAS